MAKNQNASPPEVSEGAKTDKSIGQATESVEQLAGDTTPIAEAAKPRKFRNVSATLLTKDNSSPFPSGTVTELSDAEIERFKQAKEQTGTTFIVEVKS